MSMGFRSLAALTLLLSVAGFGASDADAQRRIHGDQDAAQQGREAGRLVPSRDIERQYVPRMQRDGATYLGFVFDGGSAIYTLKFLRNGDVIWIYVDGQSGRLVGRSGR